MSGYCSLARFEMLTLFPHQTQFDVFGKGPGPLQEVYVGNLPDCVRISIKIQGAKMAFVCLLMHSDHFWKGSLSCSGFEAIGLWTCDHHLASIHGNLSSQQIGLQGYIYLQSSLRSCQLSGYHHFNIDHDLHQDRCLLSKPGIATIVAITSPICARRYL